MKRSMVAASLLVLAALSGCMKVKQEIVVMPDGSGKIVLTLTMRLKSETTTFTEGELSQMDPDEFMEKVHGLTALTRPKSEKKDGIVTLTMTGYFDDVNALKFMDDGEGAKAKVKQEYAFRREGETFVLETKGNLLAEDAPERGGTDPDLLKQREEFFRAMFAGFEFRQDVTLPGKVLATEGYGSKAERTASYVVGERDLQKPSDQRKINDLAKFKVSAARSEVSDADAAAFRKELEKAKADWPALRDEMKKTAERRK